MARKAIDLPSIIQTAVKLANTNGLANVTLASLANELGIKTPSLYNHIDGMNGLRKQLALYGMKELYDRMVEASIGKAGDKALHSLGFAYVAFARENPGLYEATLSASVDPEIGAAGDMIIKLLLSVLEEYNLTNEDAYHIIRGIRSLLHGFASLERVGGFGLSLDHDESLDRLLRTYLLGLQHS